MGKMDNPAAYRPKKATTWAEYILEEYLWVFAIILVPMSISIDIFSYVYLQLSYFFLASSGRHDDKVRHVQKQVRQWRESGAKVPMCTARPGWQSVTLQSQSYKNRLHKVEINMADILHIDEKRRIVRVEPMVSIGHLNDFLIRHGWTLPVVPELDDLTIGGLVMGGGIESTSNKFGLFQYICKAYEMVMSDGSVIQCDKDNEPELYLAIPFSYGTLGFLTAIEIDIIPYKKYIKLTYQPTYTLKDTVKELDRITFDENIDSVEGIMYSLDTGVIMSGVFTDDCEPDKVNHLGRYYKPWFYKHVETKLKEGKCVEYIPTDQFFHRHNKSFFWLLHIGFPFASNVVFRYLLGWSMPPKFSLVKWLRALSEDYANKNLVIQDFGYKIEELEEVLPHVVEKTQVFPIWLCPTKHIIIKGLEHLSPFDKPEIVVDVGVYGYSPIPGYKHQETQEELEQHVLDRRGFVALYAETYLSRKQLEYMFSVYFIHYQNMRKKFDCDKAFPHVYDKISREARN